jgi:hypothetical protein
VTTNGWLPRKILEFRAEGNRAARPRTCARPSRNLSVVRPEVVATRTTGIHFRRAVVEEAMLSRQLFVASIVAVTTCLTACQSTAPRRAAAPEWTFVGASPGTTAGAARSVLLDEGFTLAPEKRSSRHKKTEAVVSGRSGDGTPVTVEIKPAGSAVSSEISVFVGTTGDSARESRLANRIKDLAEGR